MIKQNKKLIDFLVKYTTVHHLMFLFIKLLYLSSNGSFFLLAGAVMEDMAKRLLNLEKCKFQPKHKNNLANEFQCYANFDMDSTLE